ncbi:MAG: HNH endonuclease [Cellulosilyticaceae bacterium]
MRPVNKGDAPQTYRVYENARDDLLNILGPYCSYCEMSIKNMPEVEHVIPRANGGAELEWINFLLSCKYCNTSKSNHNQNRQNYLWPDEYNTFKVFKYQQDKAIDVNDNIVGEERSKALNTIELMKLDRQPGSRDWKNHKDTRYMSRGTAWRNAYDSLNDLLAFNEGDAQIIMNCICRTATQSGHFSIWMEVFKGHTKMRKMLVKSFEGTNEIYFEQE